MDIPSTMKPYLITTLDVRDNSTRRKVSRAKNIKEMKTWQGRCDRRGLEIAEDNGAVWPYKVLSFKPVKKKGDAVVYARVSTARQANGYSFQRQIEATSDWAFDNGYNVIQVFQEIGSASSGGESGVQRRLKQRGKAVDICLKKDIPLLVEDLDRWSRIMEFPPCKIISTGIYHTGMDDPEPHLQYNLGVSL
jgi:hypothetical protein